MELLSHSLSTRPFPPLKFEMAHFPSRAHKLAGGSLGAEKRGVELQENQTSQFAGASPSPRSRLR